MTDALRTASAAWRNIMAEEWVKREREREREREGKMEREEGRSGSAGPWEDPGEGSQRAVCSR